MNMKEAPLVLLLAGGVGSRLNVLVQTRAKPAVPFAGLYRIIDFSLSNVMNSGMTHVGVMTQYKPLSLMRHVGTGDAWDFTGRSRGVKILPPSTGFQDSDWYKGTADALRQNLSFIKSHPSKEILVLSGDHVYHMDLADMLQSHRHHRADITIGMMVVPMSEIHQFGAGITNSEGRIIEWEEKPKKPRTNLASMGIYVFDTAYLLTLLEEDKAETDFGMHLIPKAVKRDKVFAYPFRGYWRDVGTIQSYWEANMDLLHKEPLLTPEAWHIRSNPYADERQPVDRCAAYFANNSHVVSSMIPAGCIIEGSVENSVLSPGVIVKKGARVINSVLFDDCVVEENAVVDLAILDKRAHIGKGVIIGQNGNAGIPNRKNPDHLYTGISLIGKEVSVPAKAYIGRNCVIQPWRNADDFHSLNIDSGETV